MVVSEMYINAKNRLKRAGISNYRMEAHLLLEKYLGMKHHQIAILGERTIEESLMEPLVQAIEKRASGYPLQYILGEWEFYGLAFTVEEGVLIPRADTETLVDWALELLPSIQKRKGGAPYAVDLCSGSGCIPISLEQNFPGLVCWAVEWSRKALSCLSKNIRRHQSRVKMIYGDVTSEITTQNFTQVDLITCNPPYLSQKDMETLQREVAHEPPEALYGGEDGLDFYRRIIPLWKSKLAPGGVLLLEMGQGQENAVVELLKQNQFEGVETRRDLPGVVRAAAGIWPGAAGER